MEGFEILPIRQRDERPDNDKPNNCADLFVVENA